MMNLCSWWLVFIRDKDGILNFGITDVFFLNSTHKFVVGKKWQWEKNKVITVEVSTKHEMGNLRLAVYCISKTYSSYCIPFCNQWSPISLRKKNRRKKMLLGNLREIKNRFSSHI